MSKRIGALTIILTLAFPALAGARIVVNQSIAGVNLGESKQQVRSHLGAPAAVGHSGGATQWIYGARALLVGLSNGRVVEVYTKNPSQKTASGIGVGSSQAAVKSRIKGVKCQHVKGFSGQECIVLTAHGVKEWTTDFHLGPNGHVQSVLVNIFNPAGPALDRALRIRP